MCINRTFVRFLSHPGIDKVEITSKDYHVKNTHHFGISPYSKKQGEDIIPSPIYAKRQGEDSEDSEDIITNKPLFCVNGEEIFARNAYHNAGEELGNLRVDIDWRGCSIGWNPSKLAGKYTGELASISDLNEGAKTIQHYLGEIGLSTNIDDYKITRIDLAKDREMSEPVFAYKKALELLQGSRMKEHVQYPDGVRIGNKSKQGIFYDKGKELEPKKGSTNNMRGEIRFLKSESVQNALNLSHLHQFKKMEGVDISNIYSNCITKDIYKIGDFNQSSFDFMSEVSILKSFQQIQKYKAFDNWVMLYGVETMMQDFGLEGIKEILHKADFDRYQIRRALKKLNQLIQIDSFRTDKPTLSKKYEEIRAKFVA